MSCSCIKGTGSKFDFKLESVDCKTLLLTDLSNWNDDKGYFIPESHQITVTLPVSNKQVVVNIKPQGTTVFNGDNLETSECLPDGIYCFSIDSCGKVYTRFRAVTCLLECRFDRLTQKLAKKEVSIEKYIELSNYLEIMKASAKMDQSQKAADFYKILTKELDNLDCECNCK
jgi:hypothetical protein